MLKNIGVGEYLCTICGCMNSHTKECSCQHDGGYMSDCKCTTKNKLSLYDQLNYINERGFCSVIVNKEGKFIIASTKAPIRRLWFTGSCDTVERAKEQLGLSYALSDEQVNDKDWQIVDTIHPSSLLGKGFQVGDKVEVVADMLQNSGDEGEVISITEVGYSSKKYKVTFLDGAFDMYDAEDLKPVLPVEEDICKDCKKVIEKGTCQLTNQCHVCEVMEYQAKKKECVHRFEFFEVKPLVKTIIGDIERCTKRIYSCVNCGLVTSKDPNK